jgi:hypothetical protein
MIAEQPDQARSAVAKTALVRFLLRYRIPEMMRITGIGQEKRAPSTGDTLAELNMSECIDDLLVGRAAGRYHSCAHG